jgi:hypothetical protein
MSLAMEYRDFETIESELVKMLKSKDQSKLKGLFEEIKSLPEEAVQYMPEVVYARYLRLLAKAQNYNNE